jgi:hypothetical protein
MQPHKGTLNIKNLCLMLSLLIWPSVLSIIGPCPHMDRDYRIPSDFWKFYLIKTGCTSGEPVSLVKVFRLFKLEEMFFWCSECGHSW